MKEQKLLVKQLSNTGELIRVISCFAGQISVFRATSPNALRPFQRAFVGLPGPEKIVISIEDENYVPSEHPLIGFGERWNASEKNQSARQYLENFGLQPALSESLLLAIGLDHAAEKPCASLSASEERRLRLAAALQTPGRVLVLNDPFDPLEPQWRERFAEMLTQHVRTTPRIVVVTSLNQRPEAWIDNERVARIQVGETVQRTIGFGSQNTELKELLSQVRAEADTGKTATSEQSVEAPPVSQAREMPPQPARGNPVRFLAFLGLLVVVGVALGITLSNRRGSDLETAQIVIDPVQNPAGNGPESDAAHSIPAVTISSEAIVPTPAPTSPPEPISLVLNLYPEEIRSSIVQSFEGISAEESKQLAARSRSPRLSIEAGRGGQRPVPEARASSNELLSVLQSTSGSAEADPPDLAPTPVEDMSNLPPEERRELIRQRFLQAIQRAAQEPS